MNKRNAGVTLLEMLIVIGIFGFIMAGTSQLFVSMLRTHRQQSRITETNIEGVIGLELLRQDLEKAGYGLPWNMGGINYNEKTPNTYLLNDMPSNPPRGIASANNTGWNNTDYLTIKAANVATNTACNKWAFLLESGSTSIWTPSNENLSSADRVIVISPGTPGSSTARTLITGGTQFDPLTLVGFAAPVSGPETRLIYGIDSDTNLRMPFNRADYFVMQPSSTEMPKRCAPGTGILYKAVVNQSDGGLSYMPLLDCVADMQVIFNRDTTIPPDGIADNLTDDISVYLDADDIRTRVKEVRVFILAHEGQKDTGYQHPVNSIYVGDPAVGRNFNLTSITNWQNYRWKVYTLVVKLDSLT